jgi:hypothetical protein
MTDLARLPSFIRRQRPAPSPWRRRLVTLVLIVLTGTLAGVAAGVAGKVWT